MKQNPMHPSLNKLFAKALLSDQDLKEILALDHQILFVDLQVILDLCTEDFTIEEVIEKTISYNLVFYALFLLKEIEVIIDFQRIKKLLLSSQKSIDYWFADLLHHFWIFLYYSGEENLEDLKELLKKDFDPFCKAQITETFTQLYLKNENLRPIISKYWTELLQFYNQLTPKNPLLNKTFLAYLVVSIVNPNAEQVTLIKQLYDKNSIDDMVFGDFDDLMEHEQQEKPIYNIFEFNKVLQRHGN